MVALLLKNFNMKKISRRKFLYFFSSLSFFYPLSIVIASSRENKLEANGRFPITIAVLKAAYQTEKVASKKYNIKEITKVRKYSEIFFNLVANKIEGMKLDFHVCGICGSTIKEAPKAPCEICNYPRSHYDKVLRPV